MSLGASEVLHGGAAALDRHETQVGLKTALQPNT